MQDQVTLLFTRRRRNPVSWLIRWMKPRSRIALALSSHVIIAIGDTCYEANMLTGVRKGKRADILKGQTIVRERVHYVPDLAAGVAFLESQLCTYVPTAPRWVPAPLRPLACAVLLMINNNYDFGGALGLGLAPDENWADPSKWFCYELAAAFFKACGRDLFDELDRICETALLAISPGY